MGILASLPLVAQTTYIEFDFQNENAGIVNPSSTVLGSANPGRNWTVGTDTSVSTAGVGVPGAANSGAASGVLDATAGTSDGLAIGGGGGTDFEWRDFIADAGNGQPTNLPGDGTFTALFKPSIDLDGRNRATFFNFPDGSQQSALVLKTLSGSPSMELRNGNSFLANAEIDAAGFSWDTDSWYYMAGSWSIQSASVDQAPATIYLRRAYDTNTETLDPDGAAIGFGSSGLINYTGVSFVSGEENFAIGARADGGDPARSLVSYASWADQYHATEQDYDASFASIVIPEPSSFGVLIGFASLLVVMGRRFRKL